MLEQQVEAMVENHQRLLWEARYNTWQEEISSRITVVKEELQNHLTAELLAAESSSIGNIVAKLEDFKEVQACLDKRLKSEVHGCSEALEVEVTERKRLEMSLAKQMDTYLEQLRKEIRVSIGEHQITFEEKLFDRVDKQCNVFEIAFKDNFQDEVYAKMSTMKEEVRQDLERKLKDADTIGQEATTSLASRLQDEMKLLDRALHQEATERKQSEILVLGRIQKQFEQLREEFASISYDHGSHEQKLGEVAHGLELQRELLIESLEHITHTTSKSQLANLHEANAGAVPVRPPRLLAWKSAGSSVQDVPDMTLPSVSPSAHKMGDLTLSAASPRTRKMDLVAGSMVLPSPPSQPAPPDPLLPEPEPYLIDDILPKPVANRGQANGSLSPRHRAESRLNQVPHLNDDILPTPVANRGGQIHEAACSMFAYGATENKLLLTSK